MAIIAIMKNSPIIRKVRKLKVYERAILYSSNLWGGGTINHYPEIRLIGKWLADWGFQSGQYVDVTIEQDKLIITHNSEHVNLEINNNNGPVKTLC